MNDPTSIGRWFGGMLLAMVLGIIAALGVAAVLSQMGGISLELFSRDLPMLMLLPLVVMQLVLCLWLLARGFAAPAAKAVG
jgi:hypothetical protein